MCIYKGHMKKISLFYRRKIKDIAHDVILINDGDTLIVSVDIHMATWVLDSIA